MLTTPDLITYCEDQKVPFVTFNDFSSIHKTTQEIYEGKLNVKDAALGRIHV